MELTLWTYEGPPHVGAMRIAASMSGLHYVLHAPQGDTYADLLFTMIERRSTRPPVTYTTFEARDLGGDTAELFKTAVREAYERWARRRCSSARRARPNCSRTIRAVSPARCVCPSRSFLLSCPPIKRRRTGVRRRRSTG